MFTSLLLASFLPLGSTPSLSQEATHEPVRIERRERHGKRRLRRHESQGVPFASQHGPRSGGAKGKKGLGQPSAGPVSLVEPEPTVLELPAAEPQPGSQLPKPQGVQKPGTKPGPRGGEVEPAGEVGGEIGGEIGGEVLGGHGPGGSSHGSGSEIPASAPVLGITPTMGFSSYGPQGGPFEPQDLEYLLTNSTGATLSFAATADAGFVQLSEEGGAIAPGATLAITATIDPSISAALPVGNHAATITFTDLASGEEQERDVTLSIAPVGPTGLTVLPASGLTATGPEGGPFQPGSLTFALANRTPSVMAFSAEADMGWIQLDAAGGTINPGEVFDLTASIDPSIMGSYPASTYSGSVTITDLGTGEEHERDVQVTVATAGVNQVTQLSQFGITWFFDRAYEAGQFANGDWWVVGPVTIVGITPASTSVNGRVMNGSMINPSPRLGSTQGYDSSMYAQYKKASDFDNSLNVAYEVSAQNPLKVTPHSSIVSTISRPEPNVRPQIRTAAVLTVLPRAAQEGDFRPSYSGRNKQPVFNEAMLDYSLLQRLPIPASAQQGLVSLDDAERMFERPWIDHVPLWVSRYTHPSTNMPDYGREIVDNVSVAALLLHLDMDPTLTTAQLNAQKRDLLVRFVQLGLDFYGIAMDGGQGNWRSAAGHMSGRKWPILFAGLMLDDEDMAGIGETKTIRFGEDDQTFVVSVNANGEVNGGHGGYTMADVGTPEWGTNHPMQPWFDDANWFGDPYRLCCTANAWWGQLLAARIMDATDEWNHDVLFDYQDRFLDQNENVHGVEDWRLSWRPFYLELWKTYRPQF